MHENNDNNQLYTLDLHSYYKTFPLEAHTVIRDTTVCIGPSINQLAKRIIIITIIILRITYTHDVSLMLQTLFCTNISSFFTATADAETISNFYHTAL